MARTAIHDERTRTTIHTGEYLTDNPSSTGVTGTMAHGSSQPGVGAPVTNSRSCMPQQRRGRNAHKHERESVPPTVHKPDQLLRVRLPPLDGASLPATPRAHACTGSYSSLSCTAHPHALPTSERHSSETYRAIICRASDTECPSCPKAGATLCHRS